MSVWVWCEFVCDGCAEPTAGRHTRGAIPRREMIAEAKLNGWRFSKNGDTHCEKCALKYKEEQSDVDCS